MAYMSFSPWATADAFANGAPTPAEASRFTAVELRVIALAEHVDATREFHPESRRARFLDYVFGVKRNRPLANPRLETLRRFASLVRHHPERVGDGDVRTLMSSGFSSGQAFGLLAYLSAPPAHPH
jgi:alkylhydroperoxidase family enzyme